MTRVQTDDRGDIVLGWLTKLVVTLAAVGVVGFDGVSIASKRFSAEDHAQTAARTAATSFREGKDLQKAYDAALAEVSVHGDTIDAPTFRVGPDGSVTLTLRTQAPTLLVEKIGPITSWADISTTVQSVPAP